MRRVCSMLIALGAAGLAMGVTTAPAHAATGQVVVFATELTPLSTYENPDGCYAFPPGAHVLNNLTDKPVQIHSDPLCLTPGPTVKPGYGVHVPEGFGSFSV
jgi:hypothetical protein